MERTLQDQIVAELIKQGWEAAPKDLSHVVVAQLAVNTFRSKKEFAKIHPIIVFEDGIIAVEGEFISKGDNVLSLCCAYIKTPEEIPSKIATFHKDVLKCLSQAFSVRMAN